MTLAGQGYPTLAVVKHLCGSGAQPGHHPI